MTHPPRAVMGKKTKRHQPARAPTRLDPREARSIADRGREALRKGDLRLAVSELSRVWEALHDPAVRAPLAQASHRLGLAMVQEGKLEDAATHLDRAFALDVQSGPIAIDTGRIAWRTGRIDQASAAMGRALELDPTSRWACVALALVRIRMGKPADAMALLERLSPAPGPDDAVARAAGLVRLLAKVSMPASPATGPRKAAPSSAKDRLAFEALAAEHASAARAFGKEAARTLEDLFAARREEAALALGEGDGLAVHAALVPERHHLVAALASPLDDLARVLADLCNGMVPPLTGPAWEPAAARALDLLVDGDAAGARVALGMVPSGTPLGLAWLIESVSLIREGQVGQALAVITGRAAEGLPGEFRRTLESVAMDRAGADILDAMATGVSTAAHPSLAVDRVRERKGEILFRQGDFAGALAAWEALERSGPRIRKGMALALEGLGRDQEAIAHWRALIEPWLAGPATQPPPWEGGGGAIVHLATLIEDSENESDDDAEAGLLLERGAERFPSSGEILAKCIKFKIGREETNGLTRLAAALWRLAPDSCENLILAARAYDEVGDTATALRAATAAMKVPAPDVSKAGPFYEDLLDDRVVELQDDGRDREALRLLDDAARVKKPTSGRLFREAEIRKYLGVSGVDDCIARAIEAAPACPRDVINIVSDLISAEDDEENETDKMAKSFLQALTALPPLSQKDQMRLFACLLAAGLHEKYAQWRATVFAKLSGPEQANFLAGMSSFLGADLHSGKIAIGVLEEATQLDPKNVRLKEYLAGARAACRPFGLADTDSGPAFLDTIARLFGLSGATSEDD